MESSNKISNLQSLLRLAVEQKTAEEPCFTDNNGLDAEKKLFLDSVLKSMTTDVLEEVQKAISTLENILSSFEEKRYSLNVIRDYIDNMDTANSFIKANGTKTLLKYLKAEEDELRTISIYIVSEMSQNNTFSQQYFLDEKVIPLLISYLKCGKDVCSSALHAISALITNFEAGLCDFIQHGGIEMLMPCLKSDHAKVYIKTCFLIATLSAENSTIRDELIRKGSFPDLFKNIETVKGFDIKIETTLFALSELSKSPEWRPTNEECINIKKILNYYISINETLPECEDAVTYARNIISRV